MPTSNQQKSHAAFGGIGYPFKCWSWERREHGYFGVRFFSGAAANDKTEMEYLYLLRTKKSHAAFFKSIEYPHSVNSPRKTQFISGFHARPLE